MIQRDKLNYMIHGLFLIFIILVNFNLFKDGDLFFHISIGEEVINSGFITHDPFSYFELQNYSAPQWLADVALYLIYKYAGFIGIGFSMFLFYIIMYGLLYKVLTKLGLEKQKALLITSITLLILESSILMRPQIITYILFILEIYMLEKYFISKNIKYLYPMPILALLSANFHFGFLPLFFVVFLPYIFEFTLKFKFERIESEGSCKSKYINSLILTGCISIIFAMITPYLKNNVLFIIVHFYTNMPEYISEWKFLNLSDHVVFFFYLSLYFSVFIFTRSKMSLRSILLIGGTLIMTLKSVRFFPYLTLSLAIYCIDHIKELYANHKSVQQYSNKNSEIRLQVTMIILISILTVVVYLNLPPVNKIPKEVFPVEAVAFIKKELIYEDIKLYNHFNTGAYLLFEDIKVFIDSRAFPYVTEFNKGTNVFLDFIDLNKYKISFKELIEKYSLTHGLVTKGSEDDNRLTKEGYKNIIYEDNNFIVYEF